MTRRILVRAVYALAGVLSVVACVMLVNFWRHYDDVPEIRFPTTGEEVAVQANANEAICYNDAKNQTTQCTVHIWSSNNSTATVSVEGRITKNEPFVQLYQVINPDKRGELWSGPKMPEMRASVQNYAAGEIHWSSEVNQ